jgi:hypothetical protein
MFDGWSVMKYPDSSVFYKILLVFRILMEGVAGAGGHPKIAPPKGVWGDS